MFKGSIVAIVTPFIKGELDERGFRTLVRYQMNHGTDGIVVGGSTGESANISNSDLQQLIRWTKDEISSSSRKIPVIAGAGTNSTKTSIERSVVAESEAADGLLLVTPYYNKPTPAGLYRHFKTVADSVKIPVILYNVPGRTGVSLPPETVADLARIENIVALKEAGGNLDQVSKLRMLSDITILSGDDTLTLPMLALGAQGVISVTANIDPSRTAGMCKAFESGNLEEARRLHFELFPVSRAMFIETNPCPVKAALEIMGLISDELRLPLVPVSDETRLKIKQVLLEAGLTGSDS